MMPLINSIIEDKTKWRLQEVLITKLAKALHYFNANEI